MVNGSGCGAASVSARIRKVAMYPPFGRPGPMLQRSLMRPTHRSPRRSRDVSSSSSGTDVFGEEGEDALPVVLGLGLGVARVQRAGHLEHPRRAVVVAHER